MNLAVCVGTVPYTVRRARMQGDCRTRGGARPRPWPAPPPAEGECSDDVGGMPARLFLCGQCRVQVLICSHCDRGNMYCGDCGQEARRRSQREAGRRYQASRRGRFTHAARSRRYRARRNLVTHQGSPPDQPDDLLSESPAVAVTAQLLADKPSLPRWHCHCCGRRCPEFVRRDFLHLSRDPWHNRRGPRRDHPP